MKIPEHLALGYLLAQLGAAQHYGPAGTALVVAASFLPDCDGLSLLGGWRAYRRCHRVLGHGILVTLAGPALLALLGWRALGLVPFWPLWGWLQLALLSHLFTDVLFYRWPAQLLWPFSSRAWGAGLVAWNDLVPTLLLYGGVALCLMGKMAAPVVAAGCSVGLVAYLGWRALWPRSHRGWRGWLTGDWAPQAPAICRWLTGDFIT